MQTPVAPSRTEPLRPERALTHPLWLASLALLAANDHLLKGSGLLPGAVTGKLSDVAGLVVAPALLAAITRVRSRAGLFACHGATGVGYVALEFSGTLAAALHALLALVGLGWASYRDPTDLLALPALALSYVALAPAMRGARPARGRRLGRALEVAAGALGMLACLATSAPDRPACVDCDNDGFLPPEDCNDADARIHPDADDPHDEEDSNCDGRAAPIETVCGNGDDDDGDGRADCDDPDCAASCGRQNLPCNGFAARIGTNAGETRVVGEAPSDVAGTCVGSDGGEALFGFYVPDVPLGVLSLSLKSDTPHGLHVRLDCNDPESEIACEPAAEPSEDGTAAELRALVPGRVPVYIVVEAAAGAEGPFTLALGFSPLVCGDGVTVEPEECDDGDVEDGDGCSAACEVEP